MMSTPHFQIGIRDLNVACMHMFVHISPRNHQTEIHVESPDSFDSKCTQMRSLRIR